MRGLVGLVCVLFFGPMLIAATQEQIDAWKIRFPAASVAEPFPVRQLSKQYEDVVRTVTKENLEFVVWTLREKAEREILAAREFAGRDGVTGNEAKAKIVWLQKRLLPYLKEKH